jgi:GNAT superfamily N-acetyltransferase
MLRRLVSRARELRREFGLETMVGMAVKKAISPVAVVGTVYFFECDLRQGLPQVRPVPGIALREGFLSDVDLLNSLERGSERRMDAIERLNKGDRWFIAVDETTGKLANYRWVTASSELIPELARYVLPRPGEVFIHSLYTAPEYRRKGIDSFARQWIYERLHREDGIIRVLATIFGGNAPSFRAGRNFLRQIGCVRYVSIRGGAPHLFSFPKSGMAELGKTPRTSPPRAQSFAHNRS